MQRFQGIVDTLEDDAEQIHQISAKIESRVSRMKNKGRQATIHSNMEAVQNCILVKEKIEQSQLLSKRVFKRQNIELCAHEISIRLKKERDESRVETQWQVAEKPHAPMVTSHEHSKKDMLANNHITDS